jgi:hypothetical protein
MVGRMGSIIDGEIGMRKRDNDEQEVGQNGTTANHYQSVDSCPYLKIAHRIGSQFQLRCTARLKLYCLEMNSGRPQPT